MSANDTEREPELKIHLIIDFSHIYYKYMFQLRKNRLKHLTAEVFQTSEEDGSTIGVQKDVSFIYYPLREVENMRKKLGTSQNDLTISICFDRKSDRRETSTQEGDAASLYKANREKTLQDSDLANIDEIMEMLSEAGHNTYAVDGCEADDVVAHLARTYRDDFECSFLYSNDADMMALIEDKIAMYKYRTTGEYAQIHKGNFDKMTEKELKCVVPYNAVMLFKATTGDTSDNIKGVPQFGIKAFEKLVKYLDSKGVDWGECLTYEGTKRALELSRGFIKDEDIAKAMACLDLVRPIQIDKEKIAYPSKKTTEELRRVSYSKYNMLSLI